MAKKIKIRIETDTTKIRLPKLGLGTVVTLARIGLWATRFNKDLDASTRESIRVNRKVIVKTLKSFVKGLKPLPPFTLVEVNSDRDHILIDIL